MKSVKNTHLHFLKAADGLTAVGACEREMFNWWDPLGVKPKTGFHP